MGCFTSKAAGAPAPTPPPAPAPAVKPGFAPCANPGCPCVSSWNGVPGEFCGHTCRGGTPCASNVHTRPKPGQAHSSINGSHARCARPGCPCIASYNGVGGEHCCMGCKTGTPCATARHTAPTTAAPKPKAAPPKAPAPPPSPIVAPAAPAPSPAPAPPPPPPPPKGVLLKSDDKMYKSVEKQLNDNWLTATKPTKSISAIWRIDDLAKKTTFDQKRNKFGKVTPLFGHGTDPGNVIRTFHGTRVLCAFTGTPCTDSNCNLCRIMEKGFDLGKLGTGSKNKGFFGPGIYTTLKPATAFGYPVWETDESKKVLLVLLVALGNAEILTGVAPGATHTTNNCTAGFDSRVVQKTSGIDEEVLFDKDQLLLRCVVFLS